MTNSRRLPLSEDPRYIGSSLQVIRAAVPGLKGWLGHVFKVMGGFMVATGALMSAINFLLHSDFRWLLLLPALLWLLGLACYLKER